MADPFEALKELVENHLEFVSTGEPVDLKTIAEAESFLGLSFDEPFKLYLSTWGHVTVGPLQFYGISDCNFSNGKPPNAVWFTALKRVQVKLPPRFVIVFNNEGDEYHCIDTEKSGLVVIWDVTERAVVSNRAKNVIEYVLEEATTFLRDWEENEGERA